MKLMEKISNESPRIPKGTRDYWYEREVKWAEAHGWKGVEDEKGSSRSEW